MLNNGLPSSDLKSTNADMYCAQLILQAIKDAEKAIVAKINFGNDAVKWAFIDGLKATLFS